MIAVYCVFPILNSWILILLLCIIIWNYYPNMDVLVFADFKNLDDNINKTRCELKHKVNKLRDLEQKEELRGFSLNPLSKEEMAAVQNVLWIITCLICLVCFVMTSGLLPALPDFTIGGHVYTCTSPYSCHWWLVLLHIFFWDCWQSQLYIFYSDYVSHFYLSELNCKNGQLSVRPSSVNVFKTLRLQDQWAEADDTWHVYSMGQGTKLLGSRILNFGHMPHGREMTHPELGAHLG